MHQCLPVPPLDAVAEVHRDGDRRPVGGLEAVHADREQVGDPREGHRHRMHVHPGDVADDAQDGVRVRRSCRGRGVQVAAHRVEQERPGAASRVEDALVQRVGHNLGDDLLGEPVRRVVLAEPVPLAGADHRFVQDLHDVVLDLAPGEPGEPARQGPDPLLAAGDFDDPVEEVVIHDASDLRLGEQAAARQDRRGDRRVRGVYADYRVGDDLGGRDEQGVLDEEPVVVGERGAERRGEQLRPQLTFQLDRRQVPVRLVQHGQVRDVQGVSGAVGAEPCGDLPRGRLDLLIGGEHALQPQAEPVHVRRLGVDLQALHQR